MVVGNQNKKMSDTYNYNSGGSPFGGLGGLFGGNSFGGNGFMDLIGLVIVASIFGWGGNGWGGFGGRGFGGIQQSTTTAAETAALVGQQQTAERVSSIATGVDAIAGLVSNQGTKLETVKDAVVNGFYANQTGLCQAFNSAAMQAVNNQNATTALLNDMRFANQQCCCEMRSQIDSKFCTLSHQLQTDKADTLRAIAAEGEATRALMRDMETRKLQEELAAAKAQLSQNAQTAQIINAVRPQPTACCGTSCCAPCSPNDCSILKDAVFQNWVNKTINPTTATTTA
jgi:hypothetical protein